MVVSSTRKIIVGIIDRKENKLVYQMLEANFDLCKSFLVMQAMSDEEFRVIDSDDFEGEITKETIKAYAESHLDNEEAEVILSRFTQVLDDVTKSKVDSFIEGRREKVDILDSDAVIAECLIKQSNFKYDIKRKSKDTITFIRGTLLKGGK